MSAPYSDDEVAAARARGAQAVDSLTEILDRVAAVFDGDEITEAAGQFAHAIETMDYPPSTLAAALASVTLRHRRAMAAAVETMAVQAAAPARRRPSPWWTVGVAAVSSAAGAIAVLWAGGAFG